MEIVIVKKFVEDTFGRKYVILPNGKKILIEEPKYRQNGEGVTSENGFGIVENISRVFIKSDNKIFEIKGNFEVICSILSKINFVFAKDGKYHFPIELSFLGDILVQVHWENWKNKIGKNYTIEKVMCLAYRNKNPGKKSTGRNRLRLDCNTYLRKVL